MRRPRPGRRGWAKAIVLQAFDLNWKAAEEGYGHALEASGGEAATHVWYTAFLVGRTAAVAILQRTVVHFGYCNSLGTPRPCPRANIRLS